MVTPDRQDLHAREVAEKLLEIEGINIRRETERNCQGMAILGREKK
jgi:hypothetical protein